MPRTAVFKNKCASPWCVNPPTKGSYCSDACKVRHSRVKSGKAKMPDFDPSLTPVTVIVSKEQCYALIQIGGSLQIRELTEEEANRLIDMLKPVTETIDGFKAKTTLESVPDIGNVESGDWDQFTIREMEEEEAANTKIGLSFALTLNDEGEYTRKESL